MVRKNFLGAEVFYKSLKEFLKPEGSFHGAKNLFWGKRKIFVGY